jgi:hypothetical protein
MYYKTNGGEFGFRNCVKMLFIDCFKILMTVTLNTAGDVSFNSLNLTSFPTSGNFYFVKNTSYTSGSSDNPGNEYGTICIGPIQIKFGNVSTSLHVVYTNSFPNQCISACGTVYNGYYSIGVAQISSTAIYFTSGVSYNVFWITIGC